MVNSYKLIARGSVEEKIVRLQEKKKELIANTLRDSRINMIYEGTNDIQRLVISRAGNVARVEPVTRRMAPMRKTSAVR